MLYRILTRKCLLALSFICLLSGCESDDFNHFGVKKEMLSLEEVDQVHSGIIKSMEKYDRRIPDVKYHPVEDFHWLKVRAYFDDGRDTIGHKVHALRAFFTETKYVHGDRYWKLKIWRCKQKLAYEYTCILRPREDDKLQFAHEINIEFLDDYIIHRREVFGKFKDFPEGRYFMNGITMLEDFDLYVKTYLTSRHPNKGYNVEIEPHAIVVSDEEGLKKDLLNIVRADYFRKTHKYWLDDRKYAFE